MYRLPAVVLGFAGLVGFRQNTHPDFPDVLPELAASKTGLYVTDVSPSLISAENIVSCMPKQFKLSQDETPQQAVKRVFNEYLKNTIEGAVAQVVNAVVVTRKLSDGGAKSILQDIHLYRGAGNINDRLIKQGRFRGVEIELLPYRDILAVINRVGLQTTAPNPQLKYYLYHSSAAEPIKIFDAPTVSTGSFDWAELNAAELAFDSKATAGADTALAGSYYFGYYEDDIAGQVVRREKDFTIACGTCDTETNKMFHAWSRFVKIHPFCVDSARLQDERRLWDTSYNDYAYNTNNGLNLSLSVNCDYTQFILRNKNAFAAALQKQIAVSILTMFAHNQEGNAQAQKAREMSNYLLDNREFYTSGLARQLEKDIAAINIDFNDVDSPCLPEPSYTPQRIETGVL